jgi:hypothetical protein
MQEVEKARNLDPASASCVDFIREYAWVTLVSGFRVRIARRIFPELQKAFRGFECGTILQHEAEVRNEALKIIRSQRKIDAILKAVNFVSEEGWAVVKNSLLSGLNRTATGIYPSSTYFDYVDRAYRSGRLPFMGMTNGRYLAKNLGFDLAKNDRHLRRLSREHGYPQDANGVQSFVEDVARSVGERVSVIETVLFNACEAGAI